MKILIDTHIFLWWLRNNPALSKKGRKLITEAEEVFVSSASIWEIAIKIKLKKLEGNLQALTAAIDENGFIELPITAKHILLINELKDLHRDPFDRIMLAQACSEPMRFLTSDKLLGKYSDVVQCC